MSEYFPPSLSLWYFSQLCTRLGVRSTFGGRNLLSVSCRSRSTSRWHPTQQPRLSRCIGTRPLSSEERTLVGMVCTRCDITGTMSPGVVMHRCMLGSVFTCGSRLCTPLALRASSHCESHLIATFPLTRFHRLQDCQYLHLTRCSH